MSDSNHHTLTTSPPYILDGSTGYVLLEKGLPADALFHKIWSARALIDPKYHQIVIDTHKSYLHLGSDCITTNNYGVQPTYYEKTLAAEDGRTIVKECLSNSMNTVEHLLAIPWQELMLQHIALSVRLAKQAVEEYRKEIQTSTTTSTDLTQKNTVGPKEVFGCLPPLVESHQPGEFHRVLLERGERWFIDHYKDIARVLLDGDVEVCGGSGLRDSGVDVLLFETMNCWEEAELGLRALKELSEEDLPSKLTIRETSRVPVIVSFEGSLRHPVSLKAQPELCPEVFRKVLNFDMGESFYLHSVGLNCAPPEDIMECLEFCAKDNFKDVMRSTNILDDLKKHEIGIAIYGNLHERKIYDEGFNIGSEVGSVVLDEHTITNELKDHLDLLDVNSKIKIQSNLSSSELSLSSGDDTDGGYSSTSTRTSSIKSTVTANPIKKRKDMCDYSDYTDGENGYALFCTDILERRHGKKKFGVTSIGGCCGCGPDGMRDVIRKVVKKGAQ